MRIPSQLGYVLSGTAALALLAGCSGGGVGTPGAGPAISQQSVGAHSMSIAHQLPQGISVLRTGVEPLHLSNPASGYYSQEAAAKGGAAVIISDAADNLVNVYSTAGKLTVSLSGFSEPQGLATDKTGNLYVADTANSRVQVYAKGFKGTPKTVSDPGQFPAGVAVDSKGNLGVTNIISTSGGPGSVSFFTKGGTLIKTISNANWGRVYFDAFDDAGNLYIDGTATSGAVLVGEILKGAKGSAITTLTTANAITFPGGVGVTTTDKIAIDDQSGFAVFTYNVPKKGSLGTPVSTTPLTGASDPVTFAFTSTNKDLWTADAGLANSGEYAYPKGGSALHTISVGGQPIGAAVTPDEQP